VSTRESAGYSGTPLAKKLGLKPDLRVLTSGVPGDYAALTDFDLSTCKVLKRPGAFDFAHAFVTSRAELERVLETLDPHLDDAGMIWISWPKKASKVATDLTEDGIRELALPRGLVDVKVCAVDAVWSGLKLVRRVTNRKRVGKD
jgi:hypothetical protein